ncbi:MAG: hypothetical protein P9M15_04755 [Candidatus Electryoneaceae bacterium]|nr:hypothetical protein [Candidatus Electryoneaceae bacterium]
MDATSGQINFNVSVVRIVRFYAIGDTSIWGWAYAGIATINTAHSNAEYFAVFIVFSKCHRGMRIGSSYY